VNPTSGKVTGRIWHIRARNPQGPRHDPDHPDVARDVNNLGSVLRDLGDLARASFERALAIEEAVYGPDHLEVATGVNNLGLVLRDLGDLAGARESYERALRILEEFLPPDHPHIKIVRKHLESLG
jgi:tetratricopeptide (TPR) repeat protein